MAVFSHYSVMLKETIDGLNIQDDGIYFDCTAGGGGHSLEIARRLGPNGRLIAIDRDETAIAAAQERLHEYTDKVTFVHLNFSFAQSIAVSLSLPYINGAVIDLGVSSYQLDTAERGFSYQQNAPLDMRMDQNDKLTAYDVVNGYDETSLVRILRDYGEERFAPQIARRIMQAREKGPIATTAELVEIVKQSIPLKAQAGGHHPAKRTFQAIRIEVNGELDAIEPTLRSLTGLLAPKGRLCVITFHSLEDRIVKQTFSALSTGCTCPPSFPVCICGKKPIINLISKKPILPGKEELQENPRSRSAKLRIIEKL